MKIALRSQVLAVEMAKWVAPTDEHEARLAAAQRTLELVELYEDDVRAVIAAGLARDKSLLGVAGADTPAASRPAPAGHAASAVAALAAAFPDAAMTVRPLAPPGEDLSDQPPAARAGLPASEPGSREAAVGAGHEEEPSP